MEVTERTISFSIQGEFITQLAREKCYEDGKFDYAVELLMSCMVNDELTEREVRHIAIDILNGEAELKGIYPSDDYGLRYLDSKDTRWDLGKLIQESKQRQKDTEEECNKLRDYLIFIREYLEDYKKRELNRAYEEEHGEVIFNEVVPEQKNGMLESYLERMKDTKKHTTEDYGWLEPDGTFHEVEWCEHQQFAVDWMKEHLTEEDWLNDTTDYAGDYLTDRGWVLLHNPAQGIAYPTKNPLKRYTKAQKEFLYDYYMERNCTKEANEIFEEDE